MNVLIVAGVESEHKLSVSTICAVPVFGGTAFFCFSFQDRTKHTTFASEFRSIRLMPEKLSTIIENNYGVSMVHTRHRLEGNIQVIDDHLI